MQYPNKITKNYKKEINYANRGMGLENLINDANKYYLDNNIALIYKKPTPVDIKKISYEGKKEIVSGVLKHKSTLDYVGLYQGKYLDFDAKSTKQKTSFPLSNIHEHQILHIQKVIDHGGISFLIIEMNNSFFILNGIDLLEFIKKEKRKSIPYDFIEKYGKKIKLGLNPVLDYIQFIKGE